MRLPPFIPNPDAHQCLVCTLAMAVGYLRNNPVALEDVERVLHRRPQEGTWTHDAYLAISAFPDVEGIAIDPFDYAAFSKRPMSTLMTTFPPAIATLLAQSHDLPTAAALAERFVAAPPIAVERRTPTWTDVVDLIGQGFILIINVNAAALRDGGDAAGHSLLLFAVDDDVALAHDPGVHGTGTPARRIPKETLLRAWSYMGPEHRELLALRRAATAPAPAVSSSSGNDA